MAGGARGAGGTIVMACIAREAGARPTAEAAAARELAAFADASGARKLEALSGTMETPAGR